jgi:putative SOS response-associated peptidase YedK
MCGRYVSIFTPEQLSERFGATGAAVSELQQRYNVAPTNQVPVIVDRDGQRTVDTMRWGLVPVWAKQLGKGPMPINARVETVHEKQMFSSAFKRRRVIIPANGFYEWQPREGSTKKQPWFIHAPDNRPLGLAGIWGRWTDKATGDVVESTCIITRPAAGRMAALHDRMPVVLPDTLLSTWLAATEHEAPYLHEVIASAGIPELEARTVSDRVNNVRNEGPELVAAGTVAL